MGELNAYGIYLPVFLVQVVCAFILFKLVTRLTNVWVAKGWVAWPSVFNICLYVVVLMGVHQVFLMYWGI